MIRLPRDVRHDADNRGQGSLGLGGRRREPGRDGRLSLGLHGADLASPLAIGAALLVAPEGTQLLLLKELAAG